MARTSQTGSAHTAPAWAWAWLGLSFGLALALVMYAPARWLGSILAHRTGGQVLLQGARGTVWNGSAQLVITAGHGSRDAAALPSRLEWTLQPAPGGLRLSLFAACCTARPLLLRLQARLEDGAVSPRIEVADGAMSQWPASLLVGLGTPWNTLQLEGQVQVSTRGLVLARGREGLQMAGQAELVALGVSSRLTTLRPMGSYRIRIEGGPSPTLEVTTLEGGLQLAGTGRWVHSRLRFSGEASTSPGREAVLSNLLNIIGRREGARSIITLG